MKYTFSSLPFATLCCILSEYFKAIFVYNSDDLLPANICNLPTKFRMLFQGRRYPFGDFMFRLDFT